MATRYSAAGLLILGATVAAEPMRVKAESTWVTAADGGLAHVGLLRSGAVVEGTGCRDGGTVAELAGGGRVRCDALMTGDAGEGGSDDPHLYWGSVGPAGASVRSQPALDARVLENIEPPRTLAFISDAELLQRGWLRRAQKGYVRAAEVSLHHPSAFTGEASPTLPLAFAFRATRLTQPDSRAAAPLPVAKQARFAVTAANAHTVATPVGLLPRNAVRLAFARPRPRGVRDDAKWVHVDLREQVLTAYEGDRPVYATLVSTGTGEKGRSTQVGLFRVWLKSLHDRMHGEGYFVEEVPRILFFRRAQALHGAFWHDRFGQRASHGCINLSMADAQWLFDWAPPRLPSGWHTVMPEAMGTATLWVQVEDAAPLPLPPPVSALR